MTGGVLDRFALPGRKALVTGASRGLGRAFATALAQAGADGAVAARTEPDIKAGAAGRAVPGPAGTGPAIKAAAADIAAATGRTIVPITADVTRRADVERMVAEA